MNSKKSNKKKVRNENYLSISALILSFGAVHKSCWLKCILNMLMSHDIL